MNRKAATVLLLEDEPLIAMDLESTLAGVGFKVITIMSCRAAIEWLVMHTPDVVVVDIELQDGPSHEVVERLIKDNISFIVHSGDHPSMHIDTPFSHGLWIAKPAAVDELSSAARSLLSSNAH